ncbi:glycosyltransferase family 4 protein [Phytohabitans sp. LJ34]|uniref:glycosyltransferase family 4 protein n=1 Tax=Phytohabitans sp. LJ34 TaxID=3452217 RepID=UPI003F89ED44
MRVCVVAPALPPAVGGAEVIAESVIGVLLARGIEVDVVCGAADAAVRAAVTGAGGRFVAVGRDVPADSIAWEFDTFARAHVLWQHIRQRRPDLVHVFSHDAAVSASIAQPPVPVIGTFNEMATESGGFGEARSTFVYSLPLTLVTVSSDFYARAALRHGYPAERVRRVVTGVDVQWLRQGSAERGRAILGLSSTDGPVVLCPSRFTPRKGQLDLIAAVAIMGPARPLVVLAGSAHSGSVEYSQRIRERIAELGLAEAVRIVEEIAHRDMADVYAACHLVVQPSYAEGLGLSALEAMAAERPLVATTVSGFDSFLVHDRNALLVRPGEPAALGQRISELLTDDQLARRLVTRAAKDVSDFDIGRTANEVIGVYEEALAGTVGRPGGGA